jgi:transmembrane sensor
VTELNRHGGDRLVVRNPRVAKMHISGMFRAGDAARFGRTLAQIHPMRVVRTGDDQLEIMPLS